MSERQFTNGRDRILVSGSLTDDEVLATYRLMRLDRPRDGEARSYKNGVDVLGMAAAPDGP